MSYEEKLERQGKLVAFEGIDRAGKTSIVNTLSKTLVDTKLPVVFCGERRSPIGPLLERESLKTLSPLIKTYFFAADRAWVYERECVPGLIRGALVLWDRYVDSALVYRSVELERHPSNISLDFVKSINLPFRRPDLTFFIDVSVETSWKRALQIGNFELYDKAFLEEVRKRYTELAIAEDYVSINGEHPLSEITTEVSTRIREEFPDLFL
jgi:dTMP kinase